MEDVFALVVLTLLQLCRGEISQPEWFAANQVNEPAGYTPKPITEIFTSDSPFTSKNPALFTQPTTSTTSTLPPSPRPMPNAPSIQNVNSPPLQNGGQMPEIMSQVAENPPRNELPNFLIVFDPRAQANQNPPPPGPPPSLPTLPQTTGIQNQPMTSVPTPSTSPIPETQPPQRTTPGVPQQNENTLPPFPFQQGISPQMLSTISPLNWPLGSVLAYPIQIAGANTWINSTNSTGLPITATASPVLPPVIQTARPVSPKSPTRILSVHVKAPKGSITNIRINPTTTVRPSTTKRRKSTRRTNNYESCVNTCNGRKEPICSSPTGVTPIDPDKLKGFPSLCHMACHNSFKKEQVYEKVTDGRCGRLRTRIRPVDKNKLNREELNKAQYTIVHNAPETIVEFSPARQ